MTEPSLSCDAVGKTNSAVFLPLAVLHFVGNLFPFYRRFRKRLARYTDKERVTSVCWCSVGQCRKPLEREAQHDHTGHCGWAKAYYGLPERQLHTCYRRRCDVCEGNLRGWQGCFQPLHRNSRAVVLARLVSEISVSTMVELGNALAIVFGVFRAHFTCK